jgi:hypothetical protein
MDPIEVEWPIMEPVQVWEPIMAPVEGPVEGPTEGPVEVPVVGPVEEHIMEPIAEPVEEQSPLADVPANNTDYNTPDQPSVVLIVSITAGLLVIAAGVMIAIYIRARRMKKSHPYGSLENDIEVMSLMDDDDDDDIDS